MSEIEMTLGMPMPAMGDGDEYEALPEEAEIALSRLVAEAAQKLTGQHAQEAQQKQAQQAAEDPVIQMQKAELELEQGELRRKEAKDASDHKEGMIKLQIEADKAKSADAIASINAVLKGKGDQLRAETAMESASIGAMTKIAAEKTKAEADMFKTGVGLTTNQQGPKEV